MAKRKNISVKSMVEWANTQLARTDEYATDKFKAGVAVTIEKILTESGNYEGFRFLNPESSSVGDPDYYAREYNYKP